MTPPTIKKQTLLCIDIQKEYITAGRDFHISGISPSLENCRHVLAYARENGWDIFHVRHVQEQGLFQRGSTFAQFVEGFEPMAGEREFSKVDYSCYSSTSFREEFKRRRDEEILVIGYGSTKCCMATIIEGYHKGQKFQFVADASAAKRSGDFTESDLHAHATEILKSFCSVTTTGELVNE